jgi:hypothetical protein
VVKEGAERMTEEIPERSSRNPVAVTVIVMIGIVVLACIAAATVITVAFLMNAPW